MVWAPAMPAEEICPGQAAQRTTRFGPALWQAGMTADAVTAISTDTAPAVVGPAHGSSDTEPMAAHSDADAADDDDLLPYPSMPITHTQPAHLAALARLFGATAPAVDSARVLELGCASGGNIIPLAARFPLASFTGIDLSHRHIADGRKRIAALAIENIRLQQGDPATLDVAGERFDYVICHGVFSWVPKLTQDAIFRLCHEILAPNGVVTISYNVLPGWHLRMAIRDICLHYAGRGGSPQRRVGRARAALEQIAQASEKSEPYGQLMRTEARRLKQVPASYILGEFLAPDNRPSTSRISSNRRPITGSTICARWIFLLSFRRPSIPRYAAASHRSPAPAEQQWNSISTS
jgi:SAM-dependent methyltransferase